MRRLRMSLWWMKAHPCLCMSDDVYFHELIASHAASFNPMRGATVASFDRECLCLCECISHKLNAAATVTTFWSPGLTCSVPRSSRSLHSTKSASTTAILSR